VAAPRTVRYRGSVALALPDGRVLPPDGVAVDVDVTHPDLVPLVADGRLVDPSGGSLPAVADPPSDLMLRSAMRHVRITTGSIAGGATASVTVSFGEFPDLDYTVVAVVEESNGDLQVRSITARTASSVTVLIANRNTLTARTGTVHVLATHD
jgi:hypothetical protein